MLVWRGVKINIQKSPVMKVEDLIIGRKRTFHEEKRNQREYTIETIPSAHATSISPSLRPVIFPTQDRSIFLIVKYYRYKEEEEEIEKERERETPLI